jgi:hypothetical protein
VAISRVKSKLIVVGDIDAIKHNPGSNNLKIPVERFLSQVERYSAVP